MINLIRNIRRRTPHSRIQAKLRIQLIQIIPKKQVVFNIQVALIGIAAEIF